MVLLCKLCSHPPSKHVSIVRQDRAILLYALVKGRSLNVGEIVEQSILYYVENSFSRNIPCLDHSPMHQGGCNMILSSHSHWGPKNSSTG